MIESCACCHRRTRVRRQLNQYVCGDCMRENHDERGRRINVECSYKGLPPARTLMDSAPRDGRVSADAARAERARVVADRLAVGIRRGAAVMIDQSRTRSARTLRDGSGHANNARSRFNELVAIVKGEVAEAWRGADAALWIYSHEDGGWYTRLPTDWFAAGEPVADLRIEHLLQTARRDGTRGWERCLRQRGHPGGELLGYSYGFETYEPALTPEPARGQEATDA